MDKKTEIKLNAQRAASAVTDGARRPAPTEASATPTGAPPSGWWTFHGDRQRTGYVSDSNITSQTMKTFGTLHTLELGGPVLSVPAVVDGFVYVGLANYDKAEGGNGGALHKIDVETGSIAATYAWNLGSDAEDIHSFTGMGMTPAIVNGCVYFGAFNGRFYSLDKESLECRWSTDLRLADLAHNQPIAQPVPAGDPPAAIWSSPAVSDDGSRLYVGCGEGENPQLFSFVFCLDTATGNVVWIFCTNQFDAGQPNRPNQVPASVSSPLPGYTQVVPLPIVMGTSVWGAITYDGEDGLMYCPTGNQQPEPGQPPELPSPGYSNGILCLDGATGELQAFFQVPYESCYRPSDTDIDVASAPIIFRAGGTKYVGQSCKNGSYFLLEPRTLKLLNRRQLLPYQNDGSQLPTVDRHPPNSQANEMSPHVPNEISNVTAGENFSGAFNTAAFYPGSDGVSPRLFVALGGPNYHNASPGIDFETTPFMRAVDATSLEDVWKLDGGDPPKYLQPVPPMYTNAGESGLSSPAVVNDVVFCSTSHVSLYAFDVKDGSLLWSDDLGMQTMGYNGGYGYCLGPAIWQDYVVAGALVMGRDGGVLRIYKLGAAT
jgi:outer membrane protein assembly factor BamB